MLRWGAQWAMGILVYQLLSGHLPFWDAQSDRSPLAVMSAILNQEVRTLRHVGWRWRPCSQLFAPHLAVIAARKLRTAIL